MTLQTILESLIPIINYDESTIYEKLMNRRSLICADQQENQTAINYVWKVKDDVLYWYNLGASTDDHIILTLEQVTKMTSNLFSLIYSEYISKENFIFEDTKDSFNTVEENNWNQSEVTIKKLLKSQDIIQFEN
ncbi:hypothetical protein P261_02855 [Lachnospiraceae bacterium TWA4]|nr:hypothetical protein P261_02855 [Lachnospiraceae bacterium TWA4]